MKKTLSSILLLLLLFLTGCSFLENSENIEENQKAGSDESDKNSCLTVENFNLVRDFILKNGDIVPISNRYGECPHYQFGEIGVSLFPNKNTMDFLRRDIDRNLQPSDFDKISISIPDLGHCTVELNENDNALVISLHDATKEYTIIKDKGHEYFCEIVKNVKGKLSLGNSSE